MATSKLPENLTKQCSEFPCDKLTSIPEGETDSFPVAPDKYLTRAHCIKGIPNFLFLTITSFLPSFSSPLNKKKNKSGGEAMQQKPR